MAFPEGEQIGLIAQEVEAVLPALVMEGADSYKSVAYANLVAVLVEAINEQQQLIERQQGRIETLEAERTASLEALVQGADPETLLSVPGRELCAAGTCAYPQ